MLSDDLAILESVNATPEQIAGISRRRQGAEPAQVESGPLDSGFVPLEDWMRDAAELPAAQYNERRSKWLSEQLPAFINGHLGAEPDDPDSKAGKAWRSTFEAAARRFGREAEARYPKRKEDTALQLAGNAALSVTQGAAGAAGAIASLFGPDNAVASGAQALERLLQAMKSDESLRTRAQLSRAIDAAKASGSTAEEIEAYVNMFATMPLETLSQAVGSFATLGFGKVAQWLKALQLGRAGVTGAAAAPIAAQTGARVAAATGVAQGLGAVKQEQFSRTLELAKASGLDDEQAAALATKAQSYGLDNMAPHLAAAAIGLLAGKTGAEGAAFGRGASGGVLRRTAASGAKEAVTEGLQGGQEALAGNTAAVAAGVLDPALVWQGVAGSAALGAVTGGAVAGPIGALSRGPRVQTRQQLRDELLSGDAPPEVVDAANSNAGSGASGGDTGATVAGTQQGPASGGVVVPKPGDIERPAIFRRGTSEQRLGLEPIEPAQPPEPFSLASLFDERGQPIDAEPEEDPGPDAAPDRIEQYFDSLIERVRSGGEIDSGPAVDPANGGAEQGPVQLGGSGAGGADTARADSSGVAGGDPAASADPVTATSPDPQGAGAVILQNRNRSSPASVAQMKAIAAAPDYLRAGESSDMQTGAPVVFGAGDVAPPGAVVGATDEIVDGRGDRYAVTYMAVEADDVIASHFDNGSPVPSYESGEPGRVRVVAGNGRAAGIISAYQGGSAGGYSAEFARRSSRVGIPSASIARMRRPILVRLMRERDIKSDIGDRSNISLTAQLGPVDQAKNDANRMSAGLDFIETDEETQQILPISIRKWMASLPESEATGLTSNGEITKQAETRFTAAALWKAFGSEELVRLQAEAVDPEAKMVIAALARISPAASKLEGAGDFDIRGAMAEAVAMAVNANRRGIKLADLIKNRDLDATDEAFAIAEFLAENSRSGKKIFAGFRSLVGAARAAVEQARSGELQDSFFDPAPAPSRGDILGAVRNGEDETSGTVIRAEEDAGGVDLRSASRAGPAETEAGRDANEGDGSQLTLFGDLAPTTFSDARLLNKDAIGLQLDLFQQSADTAGQSGPGVAIARGDAVAEVKQLHSRHSILAMAMSSDLAMRQRVSLVGHKVRGAGDLAALAQVYRNPKFETTRTFFLNDNGVVVGQIGLTSRLPGAAPGALGDTEADSQRWIQHIHAAAAKLGAKSYYLLHNHPSGDPSPSRADAVMTRFYSAASNKGVELKGHIVIDTNKFAILDRDGKSEIVEMDFGQESPVKFAENGGEVQIVSSSDLIRFAARRGVLSNDGGVGVIAMNSRLVVMGITTIPEAEFASVSATKAALLKAADLLNGSRVAVVTNNETIAKRATPYAVDVIQNGESRGAGRGRLFPDKINKIEQTEDTTDALRVQTDGGRGFVAEVIRPYTRSEAIDLTASGTARAQTLVGAIRARDVGALSERANSALAAISDTFADALGPAVRWAANTFDQEMAQRLSGDLYRGDGVKNALIKEAQNTHLNAILADVKAIAKTSGLDTSTAQQLVGYYLTARYAPQANAKLVAKDQAAVQAGELDAAELQKRVDSVGDPNPRGTPTRGLAGGLNNAASRLMLANIGKRIDPAALDAVAQRVYALQSWRLAVDVQYGKTTPDAAAAFLGKPQALPALQALASAGKFAPAAVFDAAAAAVRSEYVPLTGSPFAAADSDEDVFGGGTSSPNVSKDRALDGRMDSIAEDGLSATFSGIAKTATHAGFQDFKRSLNAVYEEAVAATGSKQAAEDAIGLRRVSENAMVRGPQDDVVIYREGGKSFVFKWDDREVIDALKKNNLGRPSALLEVLGAPTRWFAYAATQLNFAFAPINYVRDAWEKSENIRARKVLDATGAEVDTNAAGNRMLALAVSPDVFAASARAAFRPLGATSKGTPADVALAELIALGGLSTWSGYLARDRADLDKAIAKADGGASTAINGLGDVIAGYNNTFDTISTLSAYMALTEGGASKEAAAAAALDLMNFRKKGTSMGPIRAMYAFAQPIVTGGAQLVRTLSTPRGAARFAAYAVVMAGLYAMARAVSEEDEGGEKVDQLSSFVLERSIPIPTANGVVKIPLGFGLPQYAWAWARNMVLWGAGEQTIGQTAAELVVKQNLKTFSPIQPSEIDFKKNPMEYMAVALAPTLLKPQMQVAVNKTAFGAPIVFFPDEKRFKSEQGRDTTADFYKEIANFGRVTLGIDMQPERWKVIVDGYMVGPMRTAMQIGVHNPNNERLGKPQRNPATMWLYDTYNPSAIRGKFDEAVEIARETQRQAKLTKGRPEGDDLLRLEWVERWDKIDSRLRAERAKITKSTLEPEEKRSKYNELAKKREELTREHLFLWRTQENRPTTRTAQ